MKKLFVLSAIVLLTACSKNDDGHGMIQGGRAPREFFSSNEEALELVRTSEAKFHTRHQVEAIEHITYLEEPGKSHAVVFYRTSEGNRSVVITKTAGQEGTQNMVTYTKCEGSSCECLVDAYIHNDGTLDLKCSCSTCKMITSN